jgi:hypothetical protein
MYDELKQRNLRQTLTYTPKRWHLRSVLNVGGSLMVGIPRQLLKWDRRRHMDPQRWNPGDTVEVAYVDNPDNDGKTYLLVRYSPPEERGMVVADIQPDPSADGGVQVVVHPYTKQKEEMKRRKKKLTMKLRKGRVR